MAVDASIFLAAVSLILAFSAFLESISVSMLWLKITAAVISFCTSLLPVLIKIRFFLSEKRSRRKLMSHSLQMFLLGEYFHEYNFWRWTRGKSTYSNIFNEKVEFFGDDMMVVGRPEEMVDLEFEGLNSPEAHHKNERVVTYGHVSSLEVRGNGYSDVYLAQKSNEYCTERVFIRQKDGVDVSGTLVVKTIKDLEYGNAKYDIQDLDFFVRGAHKLERKLEWDDDLHVSLNYNKTLATRAMGSLRVGITFFPKTGNMVLDFTTSFYPQGKRVSEMGHDIEDFKNGVLMIEYMPETGWIVWEKKLRKERRQAYVLRTMNYFGTLKLLREGYNFYEIRSLTAGRPYFIE